MLGQHPDIGLHHLRDFRLHLACLVDRTFTKLAMAFKASLDDIHVLHDLILTCEQSPCNILLPAFERGRQSFLHRS